MISTGQVSDEIRSSAFDDGIGMVIGPSRDVRQAPSSIQLDVKVMTRE